MGREMTEPDGNPGARDVSLWGPLEIGPGEERELAVGELRLRLRRTPAELLVAHQHVATSEAEESVVPGSDLPWQRFLVGPGELFILPALPDRSVVVQTDNPFWLPVGGKADLFVHVPVWVQVRLRAERESILLDLPSVVLSQTWFGSFTEGELCYWIRSGAHSEAAADPSKPHLVVCPVEIRNESEDKLLVDYFCLRVRALSLYYDGSQLWSDVFSLSFRGDKYETRQWPTGRRPRSARKARWVNGPREAMRRSALGKTFSWGGDLPGIGIRII